MPGNGARKHDFRLAPNSAARRRPGVDDGSYPIVVTNSKGAVASPDTFEVTTAGRARRRRDRLGMNALRGDGNACRGGLRTTNHGHGE